MAPDTLPRPQPVRDDAVMASEDRQLPEHSDLTERINAAIARSGRDLETTSAVVESSRRLLCKLAGDWESHEIGCQGGRQKLRR